MASKMRLKKKLYLKFESFFYKFFIKSINKYNQINIVEIDKLNRQNSLIGHNTRIFPEATIYNGLGEKSKIKIGDNCDIRGQLLTFKHGGQITIGEYSFVGEGAKIWSAKNINIGNRVLISHNVNIHDNNSHPVDSKLRHEDFKYIKEIGLQDKNNLNEKDINIADDVWIGFNSTILKGVSIGKGAIIGSNTVVTNDVPEFSVCVGNPMKIIKTTK